MNPIPESMRNEAALEIYRLLTPEHRATFSLKRFLPVPGYLSPNIVTTNSVSHVLLALSGIDPGIDGSQAAIMAMTCWQAAHYWPMYAVTEELSEAMMQTDPPDDVVWQDLAWPIPAATFLMPNTESVQKHFLTSAPLAITAGRINHNPPANLHKEAKRILEMVRMPGGKLERDMLLLQYFDDKAQAPVVHDLTVKPTWTLKEATDESHVHTHNENSLLPVEPLDLLRMRRCAQMLVNLLSFCSSDYMPKEEEHGPIIIRKEKVKKGKVSQDALAGVRWLGIGYRRKRIALGGHHASPEVHWRRGHQRNQPFGPGRKLKRLIWIEPMQILGRPTEATTTNPSTKQ